jgi:hypothetical protein
MSSCLLFLFIDVLHFFAVTFLFSILSRRHPRKMTPCNVSMVATSLPRLFRPTRIPTSVDKPWLHTRNQHERNNTDMCESQIWTSDQRCRGIRIHWGPMGVRCYIYKALACNRCFVVANFLIFIFPRQHDGHMVRYYVRMEATSLPDLLEPTRALAC